MDKRFNIRIYGLLIRNDSEVLVTDEFRLGTFMMKYPGGGLEFGEGTIECLQREFKEELGQEIEVKDHFYTTDFFQPTRLIPETQQLFCVYYFVELKEPLKISIAEKKFDIEGKDGAQSFRWISIFETDPEQFTFPIDQKVHALLKKYIKNDNPEN